MEGVHPKAKYRLVALARLVGIQLAVLVNSQHYQFVKNVSTDSVGTGLLGKMVRTMHFFLKLRDIISKQYQIYPELTKYFYFTLTVILKIFSTFDGEIFVKI